VSTRASKPYSDWRWEFFDPQRPPLQPVTPASRFGLPGKWLRRGIFRAARPVIFADHRVHAELARAIESIGAQVGRDVLAAEFPEELDPAAVVDVETQVGRMFLHRDDRVMTPTISEHGCWEPEEVDFLRTALRPGHTFLDVGANVGYMTVLGARMVGPGGRVIAVEPDGSNRQLLLANLWRNGLSAELLPVAAYSRRGFIRFVRSELNRGDHQVREVADGGSLVPCSTIDELLGDLRVDVAKIDAQGVDHEVLEGMAGLVRCNPAIVVLSEFSPEHLSERGIDPLSVLNRYRELGLTVRLLATGGGVRAANAEEVIDACRAREERFVNLVLTLSGRNASF
jgi:FkbM family methyltransferase